METCIKWSGFGTHLNVRDIHTFWAKNVKAKCFLSVLLSWLVKISGQRKRKLQTAVSSSFFLCSSVSSVHDDGLCLFVFFNRAFFLQCSPITSMQSPYVLKSRVVDNRRILHTKPLRFNKQQKKQQQRRCKNDTHTQTCRSSDGNHSWCTFLHSTYSHRYLMSPLEEACFSSICK